jgi:excisionase family DNA binding protein
MAIAMLTDSREGEILTIKQVAEHLKVTEWTIYRLAAARKISAFKIGGTWRFTLADIENWIREQSSLSPSHDAPLPSKGGRNK